MSDVPAEALSERRFGSTAIRLRKRYQLLPRGVAVCFACATFRAVIGSAGFSPNLVTLCLDTVEAPVGKLLVKHPQTAIVDFTGSARFGSWVEANAHLALCYSDTPGVNTVVAESVDQLEPVIKSLATTMSLFSAQLCTSPSPGRCRSISLRRTAITT